MHDLIIWGSFIWTVLKHRSGEITALDQFLILFLDVLTCFAIVLDLRFIELDDGKIYRKTLYLMVKTMVSCRFSL